MLSKKKNFFRAISVTLLNSVQGQAAKVYSKARFHWYDFPNQHNAITRFSVFIGTAAPL